MSLQEVYERKRIPLWAIAAVLLIYGIGMLLAILAVGSGFLWTPTTTTSTTTTTTTSTTTTTIITTTSTINPVMDELRALQQEVRMLSEPSTSTTTTSSTTSTTFRYRSLGQSQLTLDHGLREAWDCGLHCMDNPWVQLLERVSFERKHVSGDMLQWRPLGCIDACQLLEEGYPDDEMNRMLVEIRVDYRNGSIGDVLWNRTWEGD